MEHNQVHHHIESRCPRKSEGVAVERAERIIEEITAENFPIIMNNIHLHIQQTQKISHRKKSKRNTTACVTVKLFK